MEATKQRNPTLGQTSRWVSLLGGAALLAYGLKRRSPWRPALAAAGADLLVRGVAGEGHVWQITGLRRKSPAYGRSIKIRRSVIINRPADELYGFCRNLENLPGIMSHLESVTRIDERRSRWRMKAPAGMLVEWEVEIISDRPGEVIGWRSLPGAHVDNAGWVRFERAPGGRGVVVRVQLQYRPPEGRVTRFLARLFGGEPDQLNEDLRRFKQIMEAGEVATTKGQSSGRPEDRERVYWPEEAREPEPVELSSELSFPASDAPAWATGVR